MGKSYLNSRNTGIIATFFAHAFSSHDAAKFVMEEWFLSEPLDKKNSNARFEVHFMATTNLCRPCDYKFESNKLIGYSMNATMVAFYETYIFGYYPIIKKYIYEEMEVVLKMYMCETPDQLLNDVLMEAAPYTFNIHHVIDELFNNYILKSDYRDKHDRFYEKFPLNWLKEENFKFTLRPIEPRNN